MSLKIEDTGAAVRELQSRLNRAGYIVEMDGWFGPLTQAAVIRFQEITGLVQDGIAGPRTLAALAGERTDHRLRQSDLEAAALRLDVPLAALMAVNEVESNGAGFLPDGRPVILFERHIMYRLLGESGHDDAALAALYPALVNPKRGGYMGGATEHARLKTARQIDNDCALQATSWGRFQIMGFHWRTCGYLDAEDFATAMALGEVAHLDAFCSLIEADPALHKALKARKWADFAKGYNGPAYKENLYDTKLARAYERYRDLHQGQEASEKAAA